MKRYALPAATIAVLLLWWAVGSRAPRAPVERAVPMPYAAPGEASAPEDRTTPSPAALREELSAPEPALRQSVQRRFSSPVSNGAAAGGIAGAETEPAAAASASSRLSGLGGLQGSSGAPSAGPAVAASGGNSGSAGGTAARAAGGSPSKGDGRERSNAAKADAPEDAPVTGAAAGIVSAAQGLKARGDAAAMRANANLENGIMRQIAIDNKVNAGIRGAIDRLSASGRPVTWDAVAKAAGDVLAENGLEPEDVDMETAIARASGPPPPDVPPAAYAAAVKAIAAAPPLDPTIQVEIQKMADKPPPPKPRAPAPRGALDAFRQNQGVFDKALKDFGVKPEHILGILGVETSWGRNTGKYPLPATLRAISEKTGPDGRPTRAALQAGRDLAALARLSAEGNLGDLKPDQIRGSYAGAMGTPQFLPTSWEAYSRAPDGGKRDPFNFGTAAYSVGNYLRAHGYGRDVPRSVWGYNHSQEYVDKVLGLSADVKESLNAAAPRGK